MAQVQGSREQILVSAYNSGYEFIERYQSNYKAFSDAYNEKYEQEKLAMQILGFTPVGWVYYLGKGLYNGVVGALEGTGVLLANLVNNAVQVAKSDKLFGTAEWGEEFLTDLTYMAVSGIADAGQGIANGSLNILGNLGNIVGISPEWAEKAQEFVNEKAYSAKANMLNPQKLGVGRTPEAQLLGASRDVIENLESVFSDFYSKEDVFAKYMQDTPEMQKAHEMLSGTFESLGRMIPSIAISAVTGGSAIGTLASSGYFYASNYGESFSEAVGKGLSIDDANLYATQIAMIETVTEGIGGFKFGSGISGNLVESMTNEGFEEIVSELATSGTTKDAEGNAVYEDPKDLIERTLTAGFMGALSGGVMTGGQIWLNSEKQGTAYQQMKDISDGLNASVGKIGIAKTQETITKSLDEGLKAMNKTVGNEKNLAKTQKALANSPASLAIEFDEKTKKFVLTAFGEQIKNDISAYQGDIAISDSLVAKVSPLTEVMGKIDFEKIENGKKTKVSEEVRIISKDNIKYKKNKAAVDKVIDFANRVGLSIVVYDGDIGNSQGFYKDGVSYVNANSIGERGAGLFKQVAGHELLHQYAALYKNGLSSEKATEHFKKLEGLIIEATDSNGEFLERVFRAVGAKADDADAELARKSQEFSEESMAYFIEEYVKMDNVMERFAWGFPSALKRMVKAVTGIRVGGVASAIEDEYAALLKEVSLQTRDSLASVLALSTLTPETVKGNELIKRKMFDEKTGKYNYLVDFLVNADEKGDYVLPESVKARFGDMSDADAKNSEDYKGFLLAIADKDTNGIIDNFLGTSKIKDEALQKRLAGLKLATLHGYMEDGKSFRGNEVMKRFKERLFAEIDNRIEEEKSKMAGRAVEQGDLIKTNARTFRKVLALNLMKAPMANHAPLYPTSVYAKAKGLYLRDDLTAGFAVQGEEENGDIARNELNSVFNGAGDYGWLETKADFIMNELGAKQVSSVSAKASKAYAKAFRGALQVNKANFGGAETARLENSSFGNYGIAIGWSAVYGNFLTSEMASEADDPTYAFASKEGSPIQQRNVTETQYESLKATAITDESGNVIPLFQANDFSGEQPTYFGKSGVGASKSGYYLFADNAQAKEYQSNSMAVFANITKPLSAEDGVTLEMFDAIVKKAKDVKSLTKEAIAEYRARIASGEITGLMDAIDRMSYGLSGFADLYAFKKAVFEATGFDGFVIRDDKSEITSAIAWFDGQIKSVDNLMVGKAEGDAILFSKADESEEEGEEEEGEAKTPYDPSIPPQSLMEEAMFAKKPVKVRNKSVASALNDLNSKKANAYDRMAYKGFEKAYSDFAKEYKAKNATADRVISAIMEDVEARIRTNDNRKQLYNHLYVTVAKFLAMRLNGLRETEAMTNADRTGIVSGMNSAIANAMSYIDTTFTNDDNNKLDESNPEGHQFTKRIYWGIRKLFEENDHKHPGLADLASLYKAIFDLDVLEKTSLEGLYHALKKFEEDTNVGQISTLALDSAGDYAHTKETVSRQVDTWVETGTAFIGKLIPTYDAKGKRTIKRVGGLLGDNKILDHLNTSKWIADPFTYAEISSLFLKNGLTQTIQNRLLEGSKKQMTVLNLASEYFEGGGWLAKNRKKIDELEKNYVSVGNLKDDFGNPTNMAMSQVITLYHNLKREIILGRMIDAELIEGEKTSHLADGMKVKITENVRDKNEREAKGREGTVVDSVALFNELSAIMAKSDAFISEYSKKAMGFFGALYPYVNSAFKDINALELQNDASLVKEALAVLSEDGKAELLEGLPEGEDYSQIYIPFRNAGQSHLNKGDFDVDNILDLGIFSGITESLHETSSELLIDSINNLIPAYSKEVANYHGLYRIARDLNELFATAELDEKTGQRTSLGQKMDIYCKGIVTYYEDLLKDIAGYSSQKDSVSQSFDKILGALRKNFFRASLALNVKVIATQFSSMIVCGQMFGTGGNMFTNAGFMAKYAKNLFMAGSKTKAKYLIENSAIYKNRSKLSTYEVSEATASAWTKNPVENATEFLMRGITVTDNMINRALFVTLTETVNPETGALYTEQEALEKTEEAIERYQSSGDQISRSELLRTEHQVLRVFTKFLGEPMKMLTNFYGTIKKLGIIKRFEAHEKELFEYLEGKKAEADSKVEAAENALRESEEFQNSDGFQKLSDEEKRASANDISKKRKELYETKRDAEEAKRMYGIIGANIKETIGSKQATKQKLGRLASGFAGSLLWQVALGMAFKLLRGKAKDKPEDEEMWSYMGKMFGHQLATEFVGYFPFLRDVYSTVVDGYSNAEIDEIAALDGALSQIRYLTSDIANGGDFNAWKHIRGFSLTLGSALGIPSRSIERLFTTPMSWFSAAGTFAYKAATGQKVDVNQELATAVEKHDERLIEAVIAQKLDERNIKIGQDVTDEIERLAGVNGKAISIAGDYGSFTVGGIKHTLTREQQERFTEIYSRADYISAKIIKSDGYKQLNDEYKAKFLTAIFNYYYKMAKQEISGKALIAERNYFEKLVDAYDYFSTAVAKTLYNAMIKEE